MKKTLIHSIIRALRINNRKARHIFHARFHTQRKDTIFAVSKQHLYVHLPCMLKQ